MVRTINQNNQSYWQCEECGFKYGKKEWAEKCESWCKEHKSCNLEITKYAIQDFSNKEKWLQKQRKRGEEQKKISQKKKIKKLLKTGIIVLVIVAVIGGLIWYAKTRPAFPESEVISKHGLHWHSNLSIKIFGENLKIPGNIGIGVVHAPLHTHDKDGVIHMEFAGLVKKDDIKLSEFFRIWGKTFNKDCIFDKCSGANGQMKMLINNKENSDFENYMMRDEDKIEIIFEAATQTNI